MTILTELIIGVIGSYLAYKLEKIDKRQDKIELDLEVIKSNLPRRKGDHET